MAQSIVPTSQEICGPSDEPEGVLARIALRFAAWMERWFPDAFVFVLVAVLAAAAGALVIGAPVAEVSRSFGGGFWDLIPFTMQAALVVVGGYVVATSPPATRVIDRFAALPRSGRGAVAFVAVISLGSAMINWGFSLIFSGLLVRAIARREELRMDYRAGGAAAYLGLGGIWALGLSSAAAQIQANPASMPKSLLAITGVISYEHTIFLWQSLLLAAVIFVVSVTVAYVSAPRPNNAHTAQQMGIDLNDGVAAGPRRRRPGEWLEFSPVLTLFVVALACGWLVQELSSQNPLLAISNLNTYNFLFLTLGLLLHWRPRRFLDAVTKAVPATTGVLIQFPFYAGIAAILTQAHNSAGNSLAHVISTGFVGIADGGTMPLVIGVYSAVLGLFIPSGGGKWILEAPYVMEAANQQHAHLGWVVQTYNAAEALPNLINPFWMLPLLGVLALRARHIIGFTALQFVIHVPIVLGLLWVLSFTLDYVPPIFP